MNFCNRNIYINLAVMTRPSRSIITWLRNLKLSASLKNWRHWMIFVYNWFSCHINIGKWLLHRRSYSMPSVVPQGCAFNSTARHGMFRLGRHHFWISVIATCPCIICCVDSRTIPCETRYTIISCFMGSWVFGEYVCKIYAFMCYTLSLVSFDGALLNVLL